MRTAHRLALGLAACLAAACAAHGAYLESDAGPTPTPVEPVQPLPPIRPPPDDGTPLRRLVRDLEIGRPYSYRGLTVYPLFLRASRSSEVLTMDEGFRRGNLIVREKDSAEVPSVWVRNDGQRPVFFMGGEMLVGGRQNRIIRDDVLLNSRSEFVAVAVYCGEKGRWGGPEPAFRSGASLAAPGLRKQAVERAGQDQIWREIDGQMGRADVRSPTESYQQLFEERKVSDEMDRCLRELRGVCARRSVGCIAVAGRGIVGADLFSDPALFARLWPKICRSYALEGMGWPQEPKGGIRRDDDVRYVPPRDGDDVRRFLDGVLDAHLQPGYTPGAGQRIEISGPVAGNALLWNDMVVHANLLPGPVVRPMRME